MKQNLQIYLVGGAVRDKLMNLPVSEKDWVVVGGSAEQLLQQGYKPVGKDFPVFLHPKSGEEYALARTERKTGRGYGGFSFDTSHTVTLEEDLSRRDLTINAMAEDNHGQLIDPFNGREDLDNKYLRHVSEAFVEDPLRVLRVARFAARFHHLGFRVAPETQSLMQTIVAQGEMDHLVAERVWQEMHKALQEPHPEIFFQVLRDCHALQHLMPEIDKLFGIPQRKEYHPEIDTGVHTMMSLQQAVLLSDKTTVRFATLLHDLGKGNTPSDILPRHIGHEKRSLPLIKQFCERFAAPKRFRELALAVAEYHTHCHRSGELKAETIFKVLKNIGALRAPEKLTEFLLCCEADARGRTGWEQKPYPQTERFLKALHACHSINSSDLANQGFSGKALGKAIENAQIKAITEQAPKTV